METGRILLDTYRAESEQWSWRPAWHVRGESVCTLFWKFAQLNQITAKELAQLVANRTSGRRTAICIKPDVDLRDASVFDLDVMGQILRTNRETIRQSFLFEVLPGSVLRSHEHLRWCVRCMEQGFHSPLFQMRQTRTCPLHAQPLLDYCPQCRRGIPYRLSTPFLAKPFHCPHCGCDFAPMMASERPRILQLSRDETSQITLLLKFYKRADVETVSVSDAAHLFITAQKARVFHVDLNESDIQSHYASFMAQTLKDLVPGQLELEGDLCAKPVTCSVRGYLHHIGYEDSSECDEQENRINPEENDAAKSTSQQFIAILENTYRGIRRHLWRRVFKAHRRCIASAALCLRNDMHSKSTCGFCPHALAFIRWRMLWEGCGTPRYLFAKRPDRFFGILGWHLARPSPAPENWSTETKAWIAGHIFSSTCLASLAEISKLAIRACEEDVVFWGKKKSAVDYTCLWAVAGRDRREQPATIYIRHEPLRHESALTISGMAGHRRRHEADMGRLQLFA
jgi:hypothetical protein